MMNFWKQHNPNNITEKPPHYRSKSDGGAVLLYLDFLTVLEGEADIVSAVSRSTPTQSQRNRIFFWDGKGDFICFAIFSHLDSNMPLCYSAIPSRSLRRDGADLKGFGISQQVFCNAKWSLYIRRHCLRVCWSYTLQLSPPQNVSYFWLHSNCAFLSNSFLRCCQSGMSVVRIA